MKIEDVKGGKERVREAKLDECECRNSIYNADSRIRSERR
jgi:hypothetical protein